MNDIKENDNTDNIEILESLDSFIKRYDAFLSDKFGEMRRCSFFDTIPDDLLAKLANVTNMLTYKKGDKVMVEGEAMKSFYVILYGSATVYMSHKEVGMINCGECVGEGAFFAEDKKTRMATVVADGELLLLEIDKDSIYLIDEITLQHLNVALLQSIYRKLRSANHKIFELIRENERLNLAPSVPLNLLDND
jgi:CRP-like cAMP-binding protein